MAIKNYKTTVPTKRPRKTLCPVLAPQCYPQEPSQAVSLEIPFNLKQTSNT